MPGIDPLRLMQGLAGKLDALDDPAEMETLLDELEYLLELLDPEPQHPPPDLAERPGGEPEKAR